VLAEVSGEFAPIDKTPEGLLAFLGDREVVGQGISAVSGGGEVVSLDP
jgi:hypothetical protein